MIDVARAAFSQQEYRRTLPLIDVNLRAIDPMASEMEFQTLLANESDALNFRQQVMSIRQVGLSDWKLQLVKEYYNFRVGSTITVSYPRFGLGGGKDFIVKGIKRQAANKFLEVTLYGPKP